MADFLEFRAARVTLALLAVSIMMYCVQQYGGVAVVINLALWPLGHDVVGLHRGVPVVAGFEPWQLVTYGFLHANLSHLTLNMLGLVIFGPHVERALGRWRFVVLYVVALVAAAATQLLIVGASVNDFAPTIGASGAVYGIIIAAAVLFPDLEIFMFMPPVFLRARSAAIIMAIAEMLHGVFDLDAGIAHFAHLGGMAAGLLFVLCSRVPAMRRDQSR